jgi:hypothetical protein
MLVVLSLLLLIPLVQKPEECRAITDAHMEIMPRKVGVKATYRFVFTIENKWEVHDDVILVWPPGTTIVPPIPSNPHDKKARLTQIIESMTIGLSPCSACQGLPTIDRQADGSIKMVFKTHIGIDPDFPGYNPVVITVPDSCGFTNPKKEGDYTYKIATESEPSLISCEPFSIVTSRLGEPEGKPTVVTDPPVFNQPASYTISFQIGRGGWLRQEMGVIKILFPEGTKISIPPGEIKPTYITINGIPLSKAPNGTKQNLNFPVPMEIKDSGKVVIQIDSRAGIINPPTQGEYSIEVATSGDPDWVSSEPYFIVQTASLFKIKPAVVNRVAEYSLAFVQESSPLNQGDPIEFIFPDNVVLPTIIDPSVVLVNDIPCLQVEIIGQSIQVNIKQEIPQNTKLEIRFCKEAGITNPSQAGPIRLSFKTKGLDNYQPSNSVNINEQKLEITNVKVIPPNAREIATYEITIIFGDLFVPSKGDQLKVEFPFLTEPILITATEDLSREYILKIENIQNPDPGQYKLKISTSLETEPVSSDSFTILPSLSVTEVIVSGGKTGNDGWDDQEDQSVPYESPHLADFGQYRTRLHYFAKTAYGSENPNSIDLKVDTLPPEFGIDWETKMQTKTIFYPKKEELP